MPTDQITKSEAVPIVVWEVPCGNKEHAGIVSLVTFISAIASASLIVVTSIRHSYLTSTSAAKQSEFMTFVYFYLILILFCYQIILWNDPFSSK